jgi:hypothetical protein
VTTISTPDARYTDGSRAAPGTLSSTAPVSAPHRVFVLLIALGIALRAWAYFSNVSLWLDELLISRNILGLPLSHLLTKPLLLDQVAPRGFLLLEKLAVDTLGRNELALRFFPFVCSVASVLLFHRLASRALDGWAPVFALTLFAIGIPFIQYGVEVKQYIFDATAEILLLYLALTLRGPETTTRRLVLTGLAAFLIIWFSQASVVVMGGIGAALSIEWLITRDRRIARTLLITIPLWAIASLVAVAAGLRSMTPSTREFMDDFWGTGFMPLPFTVTGSVRWLWSQTLSFFTDPTLLRYPLPLLFAALSLLGIASLWRSRRDVAFVLLGPFALAVVAAAAHQYPLRGRLMFYLGPGVLLMVAAGIEQLRRWVALLSPTLGGLVAAAALAPPVTVFVKGHPPYEIENNRAMYAYLQQKRQPGDIVHIFPLSRIGTLYYGERNGLKMGEWRTSACDREDARVFLRDVDQYRGVRRLWLVSGGARSFGAARAAVRNYLATIGVRRDSLVLPSLNRDAVYLDLYDLSDTVRLQSANAESFPVSPMSKNPRPGCRPWTKPSPLDSLR